MTLLGGRHLVVDLALGYARAEQGDDEQRDST
jgi:hypothetical protein